MASKSRASTQELAECSQSIASSHWTSPLCHIGPVNLKSKLELRIYDELRSLVPRFLMQTRFSGWGNPKVIAVITRPTSARPKHKQVAIQRFTYAAGHGSTSHAASAAPQVHLSYGLCSSAPDGEFGCLVQVLPQRSFV